VARLALTDRLARRVLLLRATTPQPCACWNSSSWPA